MKRHKRRDDFIVPFVLLIAITLTVSGTIRKLWMHYFGMSHN